LRRKNNLAGYNESNTGIYPGVALKFLKVLNFLKEWVIPLFYFDGIEVSIEY